jgi:hypothetical protein
MSHRCRAPAAWLATAVIAIGVPVARAEFQVNTYTSGRQTRPTVAADGAGRFVVAWKAYDSQDGFGDGVFAQRLDAAGLPLGSEFQVNTYTTGHQTRPAAAADGSGNFVVVWDSSIQDSLEPGVFGQRYDSAGLPLGGEFQVNTYTTGSQVAPAVAANAMGSFVVAWTDYAGVAARRYDGAGVPLGAEFPVNSTPGFAGVPAIAINGAGGFVVAWQGNDGSGWGIHARRFDGAGVPLGGQFQVNTYTTNDQEDPAVAADAAGNFVVAWESRYQDGSGEGIFAQRYDAAGLPVGAEFQVNSYAMGYQFDAAVAVDGSGNFVVAWESVGGRVVAQRYDSAGLVLGGEFQLNGSPAAGYPAVAATGAGDFMTVWESSPLGDGDIFGQRNKPDQLVRGQRLRIADRSGNEDGRVVLVLGNEAETELGLLIDGDPTLHGATLRVIANGTTPSDESYVLDAAGWRPLGHVGFRYTGPTGADGDPVRSVQLRRLLPGRATLKAVLRGSVGTQSLDVVPPNAGDDGGIILQIGNGGGRYCVALGGGAGGTETKDTATGWTVARATAEPGCPAP